VRDSAIRGKGGGEGVDGWLCACECECRWQLAIILRKFLIALVSLVFNRVAVFQLAACLLVMFLAYAAQVRCLPYMGPAEFEAALRRHTDLSLTDVMHARVRASIAGIEERGRKRANRNTMAIRGGRISLSAVLGVLTSTLFNYNTVRPV